MARKIAIVISGAVSLGSYEAGVAFEVINALAHHNQTRSNPDEHFKIDTIVGTSAGAMTAAVLAHRLLFDAGSLATKETNALYQVWVKRTRIEDLLTDLQGDDSAKSLLSSQFIHNLGVEFMPAPTAPGTPHIASDSSIRLGMTMANLNGINYGVPTLSGNDFTYTYFEDQTIRTIDSVDPAATNWSEVCDVAVASGSFPFAFAERDILRRMTDYTPVNLETPFPGGTAHFTYCDGGMFDNEPLGMAKNIVDGIDGHDNEGGRYYLFVCPHSRTGDALPLTTYNAGNATLEEAAKRIISAITANAAFQDWVRSEEINRDIALLDERAEQMTAMIVGGSVNLAPAAPMLAVLASAFEPDAGRLQAALDLLASQYAEECKGIGAHDAAQVAPFVQLVFVFQKAANLMDKDAMYVIDITANETTELGGGGFHAFTGFCSEVIREHDFQVGRMKALEFIASNKIDLDTSYVPAEGTPPPIQPIPGISVASQSVRQAFYDRLKQRLEFAIKNSELPWEAKLLAGPAADIVLGLAGVKKALQL